MTDPVNHPAPAPAPADEKFSREYVSELREENKSWRLKASALEQERDSFKTASEQHKTEADAKVAAGNTAANERIMRAELKIAAKEAGLVDMDGLKLADLSKLKLLDDGSIEGADAMLEALKAAKPYLFGAQNSSTPEKPPSPKPPEAKLAKDMTDAEYEQARKQIK